MGNPVFRFTLYHAQLGTKVISEPDGWKNAKLKLERHPDFHSLVEYFEGSFIFYGNNGVVDGGIDFIKNVENRFGPDTELGITIDISFDDGNDYENVFTGQLDLYSLQELKNNKLSCAIIRNNFWTKFIGRKETPINLKSETDLDGNERPVISSVEINLTPQIVRSQYRATQKEPAQTVIENETTHPYIQFDLYDETLNEIKDKFRLYFAFNVDRPAWLFAAQYSGDYNFDIKYCLAVMFADPSTFDRGIFNITGAWQFDIFIQVNDDSAIQFTQSNIGNNLVNPTGNDRWSEYTYSGILTLNEGDLVRVYASVPANGIDFVYPNTQLILLGNESGTLDWTGITPTGGTDVNFGPYASIDTHFYVTAETIFPETTAEAFLIHDAAQAIIDRIVGGTSKFYSEHFGGLLTNGLAYASDGCAWNHIVTPGLQLRGYTYSEKQFSMSFDKWWKGANPIFNLGLGYDVISGQEVIRVEQKSYFYDSHSNPSVNFDNVYEMSRQYDESRMFKKIEAGYNKWEAEDISGIDDPQTKRVYATVIKGGEALTIHSDFIAASLAIEVTRRQTIEKSKDWRLDNDVFIIHINPDDVSLGVYEPQLDENFNSVSNLLYSETRYNLLLTPFRNLWRWLNYITIGLNKYLTSSVKFVSGEGNYDMISDYSGLAPGQCLAITADSISEKGDINLSVYGNLDNGTIRTKGLHLPQIYEIEISMSWQQYRSIISNRRKAIGISQTTTGHKKFFIKDLTYEICMSKCKMQVWPAEQFQIQVI